MFGYIYKTTNLLDGKIYVGKKHKGIFDPTYFGSGVKLHESIKKYGIENFVVEWIDWGVDLNHLNLLEKWWIKYFDSRNKDVGYNISPGGNSFACRQHTEKAKEKIRQANLGHVVSEETKKKISQSLLGRRRPQETIEKIRASLRIKMLGNTNARKIKEVAN